MNATFPTRDHATELLKLQGFVCVSTNGREWRSKDGLIDARVFKRGDGWDIEYFA